MSDRPEAVIEPVPLLWMGSHDLLPDGEYKVGWAFYWPMSGHDINPDINRPAIVVICPTNFKDDPLEHGTPFWIDSYSTEKHELWQVTVDESTLVIGQQPMITVHPSIWLMGVWHGWLQDGRLHQ